MDEWFPPSVDGIVSFTLSLVELLLLGVEVGEEWTSCVPLSPREKHMP